MMRSTHRKVVYWSEEDHCYVGQCPSLFFGGVHGSNETKVWRELSKVVREWEAAAAQRTRRRPVTRRAVR